MGGGIVNFSGYGTLSLIRCTISGNSCRVLYTGQQTGGAGIMNFGGRATITGCSLVNNRTPYGDGGGISCVQGWDEDNRAFDGYLDIFNSTIDGNSASRGDGGGIYNNGALIPMVNCTLADNTAIAGGGVYNLHVLHLQNSIVARNHDVNGEMDQIAGRLAADSAFNVIGLGGAGGLVNGVKGNRVHVTLSQLKLDSLASNGGPTQTVALLAGSVAINAGSNALAVGGDHKPLTIDQRGDGFARIIRSRVDVGAFELQ